MTDPIWKRRLVEYVMDDQKLKAAAERKKERDGGWTSYIRARVSPPFLHLLNEAAKRRGMTAGAYVRRCVAYQLARDLGVNPIEVLALTPYPTQFGKNSPPRDKPRPDDGTGFGQW